MGLNFVSISHVVFEIIIKMFKFWAEQWNSTSPTRTPFFWANFVRLLHNVLFIDAASFKQLGAAIILSLACVHSVKTQIGFAACISPVFSSLLGWLAGERRW